MKSVAIAIMCFIVFTSTNIYAQDIQFSIDRLEAFNVFMSIEKKDNQDILKVVKDPKIKEFDEPTFVKFSDINFSNGSIEVKVLSKLLKDAPNFSRGFIGIAFRINEDNSSYESIYLRPTNARSENQVRRNHSIQYYSYPDFKFERLRQEEPEVYESYTDMTLNEWITMRIEVSEDKAKLFINNNEQPSLLVNDLKLGSKTQGSIGLWVDVGTEGYFKELKINRK